MAHIAGINTQTNSKGVVTKIKVDLKKHPEAQAALAQKGLIAKTQQQIEDEEFEKKWNDPTNLTLDELQYRLNKHIDSLPWEA